MPGIDESVSADSEPREFSFGVLFVHGIGAQIRGQTLTEFATPIVQWMQRRWAGLDQRWRDQISRVGRAETAEDASQADGEGAKRELEVRGTLLEWRDELEAAADDGLPSGRVPTRPDAAEIDEIARALGTTIAAARARLTTTRIVDPCEPEAPACAELELTSVDTDARVRTEHCLVAESWWAETFAPPRFDDLASWGFRVIPWTVTTHFTSRLRPLVQALRDRPMEAPPLSRALFYAIVAGRLTIAFFRLVVALLAVPVLLLLLALFLPVAVIPIAQVRSALLGIQQRVSAFLGDSYVLLSRPVESASIVAQVRTDLAWLASRCDAVAIVAHSQGAAVSHLAIRDDPPPELRLLFTFGSGLKKLEHLRELETRAAHHRIVGTAAVVCAPLLVLSAAWLLYGAVSGRLFGDISVASVVAMVVFFALSLGVLALVVRDAIRGFEIPSLQRWIDRLTRFVLWADCYSTNDPVSNGALVSRDTVGVSCKEVTNLGSMIADHNTYWDNHDEFVSFVVDNLAVAGLGARVGLNAGGAGPTSAAKSAAEGSAASGGEPKASPPRPLSTATLRSGGRWLEDLSRYRNVRVLVRTAIGWIGLASLVATGVLYFDECSICGRAIGEYVTDWFVGLFGEVEDSGPGYETSWPTVAVVAATIALWGLARMAWNGWDRRVGLGLVVGESGRVPGRLAAAIAVQLLWLAGILRAGVPDHWSFYVLLPAPALVLAALMLRYEPHHLVVPGRWAPRTDLARGLALLVGAATPLVLLLGAVLVVDSCVWGHDLGASIVEAAQHLVDTFVPMTASPPA